MSFNSGGVRTWVVQRISAVYIALYIIVIAIFFSFSPIDDFLTWQAWLANPVINAATIVFWISMMAHVWIGGRDVIMDYLSHDTLRFSVLCLLGFFILFMLAWALKILLSVTA